MSKSRSTRGKSIVRLSHFNMGHTAYDREYKRAEGQCRIFQCNQTGCLWSEQGQKAATSFHVRPGQKVPLFACEGSKWDSHVNTNCQLNAWTLLRLT